MNMGESGEINCSCWEGEVVTPRRPKEKNLSRTIFQLFLKLYYYWSVVYEIFGDIHITHIHLATILNRNLGKLPIGRIALGVSIFKFESWDDF